MRPASAGGTSGGQLIAGVVALFGITSLSVTVLAIFAPQDIALVVIPALVATAGATVPAVLSLAKVSNMGDQVNKLANGLMDAKVRAGVADVLPDQLIDPAARHQLRADREHIEAEHRASGNGDA